MGKFSTRGAMFVPLYLHNHTTSYNAPYIIVILYRGRTTVPLTTTPTTIPIKSYKVGLLPMVTIFSFSILAISPPSCKFTKGDIAQMIELLEPNLWVSYSFFPSRSYQKLLRGLWFSYRNFWHDHYPQAIKFIRPSNISIMVGAYIVMLYIVEFVSSSWV